MRKSVQVAVGVGLISLVASIVFQNCSQPGAIEVTDPLKAEREAEAYRVALGADDETLTIGLNPVPDLKMFFVVDNSGTMTQNQFNLSNSFGSMFDPNSSESLAKFDATAYLINTAQKSLSFSSEKSLLDQLVSRQASFDSSLALNSTDYVTNYRTVTQNSGKIPGDNIGYHIKKQASPLSYNFEPAVVLGSHTENNLVKFNSQIRKLASENADVMETEFKTRLGFMSSERIPLVLSGTQYKPEFSQVVDSESGLCSVARILRKPENYFKSSDLVSFTIVSDEDDNDPQGLNCIQSVTEHTGDTDLVDGKCVQYETSINYQTTTSSKGQDICKINGTSGYNYKLSYPVPSYTTTVTYKALDQPAQYKAAYSDITYQYIKTPAQYKAAYTKLVYKRKVSTYSYLQTEVKYYVEKCVDIISDGLVVGQKCNIDTVAKTNKKDGNSTADCYAYAKTFDAKAVNLDPYKPVCKIVYRSISTCSANDPFCKIDLSYPDQTINSVAGSHLTTDSCLTLAKKYSDFYLESVPACTDASVTKNSCTTSELTTGCVKISDPIPDSKTVKGIIGLYKDQAACEAKAKTYSDYFVTSTASVCVDASKTVTSCSSAESSAGCEKISDETYKWVTETPSGDKTANNCVTWAQSVTGNKVTSSADVTKCVKNEGTTTANVTGQLYFSEIPSNVDSGMTILVNNSCGAVSSLAIAKAQKSNSAVPSTATCLITSHIAAPLIQENLVSNCTTQAQEKCTANSYRNCTGTLQVGSTSTVVSSPLPFKKVKENITCNSLCSSSVMQVCGDDATAEMKVVDYIKKIHGTTATCTATSIPIPGKDTFFTAQPDATKNQICKSDLDGVPSYLTVTKSAYRTKTTLIDYVAGTMTNQAGQQIPAKSLIQYIKDRTQQINNGQILYSAIVRTTQDSLGQGGSVGAQYEKLIQETNGQLGSVLSNDYSLVLKDLSRIIKENIERTLFVKKMKPHQIVKRVVKIPKGSTTEEVVDVRSWSQNGSSIVFVQGYELKIGDQFRVEFANF